MENKKSGGYENVMDVMLCGKNWLHELYSHLLWYNYTQSIIPLV